MSVEHGPEEKPRGPWVTTKENWDGLISGVGWDATAPMAWRIVQTRVITRKLLWIAIELSRSQSSRPSPPSLDSCVLKRLWRFYFGSEATDDWWLMVDHIQGNRRASEKEAIEWYSQWRLAECWMLKAALLVEQLVVRRASGERAWTLDFGTKVTFQWKCRSGSSNFQCSWLSYWEKKKKRRNNRCFLLKSWESESCLCA